MASFNDVIDGLRDLLVIHLSHSAHVGRKVVRPQENGIHAWAVEGGFKSLNRVDVFYLNDHRNPFIGMLQLVRELSDIGVSPSDTSAPMAYSGLAGLTNDSRCMGA